MAERPFILVTFKPERREERFETIEALEARTAILVNYGVKFQAFREDVKIVRTRLKGGA